MINCWSSNSDATHVAWWLRLQGAGKHAVHYSNRCAFELFVCKNSFTARTELLFYLIPLPYALSNVYA